MDAQLAALRHGCTLFPDPRRGDKQIPLADFVMSGFAMFILKDPSLLAFDDRRRLVNIRGTPWVSLPLFPLE